MKILQEQNDALEKENIELKSKLQNNHIQLLLTNLGMDF